MNFWIFILSIGFWILENNHFGWNASPKSDNELISDGIVLLLVGLSLVGFKA